ncbi:MAG TPA: hypothetical protein VHU81_08075 [Thermoanaerobaculia bacterium]|nr:hypothetical protein [Thermoanaerobaculia bacterium]
MDYPIQLTFKLVALAPQVYVRDSQEREIFYVRQKLLKLKEKIHVFSDSSQSRELYQINADRVLDFNAKYTFTDPQGQVVGSIHRRGVKSLWRASYEIAGANGPGLYLLEEENPWVKVLDSLLGEIPFLGIFTGMLLHPKYRIQEIATQRTVMRITKRRSFFESRFQIELEPGVQVDPVNETATVLGILLMTLLERSRG